jgi:HTH-type transcriptional regulator / antitoxin HigA
MTWEKGVRSLSVALLFEGKDLEPMIGTRARVSEVLARKRPLTIAMIRRLNRRCESRQKC